MRITSEERKIVIISTKIVMFFNDLCNDLCMGEGVSQYLFTSRYSSRGTYTTLYITPRIRAPLASSPLVSLLPANTIMNE